MNSNLLCGLIIKKANPPITIFNRENLPTKRTNREKWAMVHKFEGETVYKDANGEYISNADNIVILPKGSNYEWVCTKAGFYTIFEFECDVEYKDIFLVNTREPEFFRKLFKELEHKSVAMDSFLAMECIKGVYSAILKLCNSRVTLYQPKDKREKIAKALEYISAKYYSDIDNDYLAGLCGISTVYFRKLFFKIIGCSPINYIHKVRMEKAKDMLRAERCKVSDVALTVGYSNIYHFSKMFKKYVGKSPRDFLIDEEKR